MLGVNLLFAGFALTLNGLSYIIPVDNKVKGIANALVGVVIGVNAIFQAMVANDHVYLAADGALPQHVYFGFSAAMWLFSLNYFVLAAHMLTKSENWKIFGIYSFFAALVSLIFMGDSINTALNVPGLWVMVYLWGMWAVLWIQSFFAIFNKNVDKFSPHTLILNGIASTFVPGALILLGVIL